MQFCWKTSFSKTMKLKHVTRLLSFYLGKFVSLVQNFFFYSLFIPLLDAERWHITTPHITRHITWPGRMLNAENSSRTVVMHRCAVLGGNAFSYLSYLGYHILKIGRRQAVVFETLV